MPSLRPLALLLAGAATALAQPPADHQHWVGTWAAAPFLLPNTSNLFSQDTTLRETVHISHAGHSLRIVLTNEFSGPMERLRIGGATVALTDGNGNTSSTALPLTFAGRPEVVLAPQSEVVSDPVQLDVKADADLSISLFVPGQKLPTLTYHLLAQQTNYLAPGNDLTSPTLPNPTPVTEYYFLKGVQVDAGPDAAAIVCLGDSITDGFRSTLGANARWPNILADRLQATPDKRNFSVLDLGIGGNRVLETGNGPSALSRLDRDVIAQPSARYLILLEGINDIGGGYKQDNPLPFPPTAEDLEAAYQQIITRAHAHGLIVYGATILPYQGAGYFSPAGNRVRQAVNAWIRTSGAFDGVIDFDAVMRDPKDPQELNPALRSPDRLHPNDLGYKTMGDSIPLELFRRQ